LDFKKARKFVSNLRLTGQKQWRKYCQSGNKPDNIPSGPDKTYKKEWKGWGDWLGTGIIANQNRQYRSFNDTRKFVHSLQLRNQTAWRKYVKSGNKPDNIPSDPNKVYKKEWKGMGDCFFPDLQNLFHWA